MIEEALSTLRVQAPATLLPETLRRVGLADAYTTIESPAGALFVAWNGRGVSMVDLADEAARFEARFAATVGRPLDRLDAMPARLESLVRRRLGGDRSARVPVDLRGRTAFEEAVLRKALEIPSGEVRPYRWVAVEIGRPNAVRAVGSALGHNPVPLIIPCHRVVRSDWGLGEYSLGGPAVKRRILAAEGLDLDRLAGYTSQGIRYLGSDTTHIFCMPTCRHARRVMPQHEMHFGSEAEARARGYRPCRICRPSVAAA